MEAQLTVGDLELLCSRRSVNDEAGPSAARAGAHAVLRSKSSRSEPSRCEGSLREQRGAEPRTASFRRRRSDCALCTRPLRAENVPFSVTVVPPTVSSAWKRNRAAPRRSRGLAAAALCGAPTVGGPTTHAFHAFGRIAQHALFSKKKVGWGHPTPQGARKARFPCGSKESHLLPRR